MTTQVVNRGRDAYDDYTGRPCLGEDRWLVANDQARQTKAPRVACVGRRDPMLAATDILRRLGRLIAAHGGVVVSGNAVGSDQAYAVGANAVDPALVELWLPWATYERSAARPGNVVRVVSDPRCFRIAAEHHPAWDRLSQGARRLFARNVCIIERADLVIAFPNHSKIGGGGTGHAMRMAEALQISLADLTTKDGVQRAQAFVEASSVGSM